MNAASVGRLRHAWFVAARDTSTGTDSPNKGSMFGGANTRTTDESGRYSIDDLNPGTYSVAAGGEGRAGGIVAGLLVVIALAAGVGDGAGLGQNARAGLITRGLAEMSRLAIALGALPATLSGLAGIGDLVLTCTGGLSRNRRVGIALGQGKRLQEILDDVISAGTSVRESVEIIRAHGATPAAVVIALDRMERGTGSLSAVQEVQQTYGIPVLAVATLTDLIAYLKDSPALAENLDAVTRYRETYGVAREA